VIDGPSSCTNVHLGVNGVKHEYNADLSNGLAMTTPLPPPPSHPSVSVKSI
jgi:hypothetical protein